MILINTGAGAVVEGAIAQLAGADAGQYALVDDVVDAQQI